MGVWRGLPQETGQELGSVRSVIKIDYLSWMFSKFIGSTWLLLHSTALGLVCTGVCRDGVCTGWPG